MDKQILHFTVNEQILVCENPIKISTNKVNYIQANFDLGENWDGFDSVRAVWFNDFNCISTVLDSLGNCVVPFEVMKRKGNVKVNLVGSISEDDVLTDRLTSYPVVAVIVDCTAQITGANTSPITPSEFEQFAQRVHTDAERAEQGASNAETSAQNASDSATSARNSAESAHDDKIAIEEAIAEVIQQIEDFEQVQVVVNTLPPSSPATSDFTDGVLTLGIPQGVKGDTGNGIQSIAKTSTSGLVDTYRITYTDGQTTTFTVTNGARGDTGNGISTIEKTSTVGLVDTYTITYTDGTTTTFTVTNGEKGDKGDTGEVSLSELEQATVVQTLSDSTPYNYRRTNNGQGSGHREYDEIVGASVGWNQLSDNYDFKTNPTQTKNGITCVYTEPNTFTLKAGGTATANTQFYLSRNIPQIPSGHKTFVYGLTRAFDTTTELFINLYDGGRSNQIPRNTVRSIITDTNGHLDIAIFVRSGFTITEDIVIKPQIVDLTLAFGSTIADYVYSLEQSTAGSGVTWLKTHFPKLFDNGYQPFDAGSIKSVSGLTAHVMCDANDNIIGSYPLDSSVTLRGQYKLDANNQLYADGDVYPSSGQIGRTWGEVDLGTLTWTNVGLSGKHVYSASVSGKGAGRDTMVCSKYPLALAGYDEMADKTITARNGAPIDHIYIRDESYTTASALKTSLDGVKLVFNLAAPITEQAQPFTNSQWCDSKGTEEYVGSELPVGHNTDYPMTMVDCADGLGDGTYEAKLTIANGVKTFTWQSV